MPDMPYIRTVDFLSNIFEGSAIEAKNDDGTFTVTINTAPMVIDTENDTVQFDEFEVFMSSKAIEEGTELDLPYCDNLGMTVEEESKSLTLDLREYDIDILDVDGKTYFPVSSLSLLFSQTYNVAEFTGGSIYFIHCSDIVTGNSCFDRTNVYEDDHGSQDIINLTYNELCFAVDKLYGRPAKSEMAAYIEEKGFDKTLDEYSDDIRKAKEKLLSDSGVTPDYVLAKETVNRFGETVVDYSGLYDVAAYNSLIDEYYGVTSELSEEPSEEPSEDDSDIPSDTSSERSVIIPDGNDTPATGDHGFAAVFAFLTVIASGAVVYFNAVSKKKERS